MGPCLVHVSDFSHRAPCPPKTLHSAAGIVCHDILSCMRLPSAATVDTFVNISVHHNSSSLISVSAAPVGSVSVNSSPFRLVNAGHSQCVQQI